MPHSITRTRLSWKGFETSKNNQPFLIILLLSLQFSWQILWLLKLFLLYNWLVSKLGSGCQDRVYEETHLLHGERIERVLSSWRLESAKPKSSSALSSHSLITLGSTIKNFSFFEYFFYKRVSQGKAFLNLFRLIFFDKLVFNIVNFF